MTEREKVINNYEKMINFVIKKMNLTVIRDEIFDVGMIGFVQGIKTFDEKKEIKYSTYLTKCIKNEIMKYLNYKNREKRNAEIVSLNSIIGEEKNTELQDLIGYEIDYNKDIYLEELQKKIMKYTKENLTILQEEVLKFLYGLDGFPELNYTQIAKIYNTTRQNIYDIHKRILKNLRQAIEKEKLND